MVASPIFNIQYQYYEAIDSEISVKVSIWEPAVNSFSGVDPLPYESVPRAQGMSAPNVFRCRSSLSLWRTFQVVHSLRYGIKVIPHAASPACALSS